MADLSYVQYVVLVLLLTLSSLMSAVGSALIIKVVRLDLTKVHHRTLLLLSVGDIVLSANYILQPFLLPQGMAGGRPWASGNQQTCSATGFVFTSFGSITYIMGAFLSVNFLFQVRYRWSEDRIKKWLAPAAYCYAVFPTLVTAVPGLATESYNPTYLSGLCFLREWPADCHEEEDLECIRGGPHSKLLGLIGFLLTFIGTFSGFLATFLLHRTVKSSITASNRHHFSVRSSGTTTTSTATEARSSIGSRISRLRASKNSTIADERQRERLRFVNWQCIMYSAAFFNTFFFMILFQVAGAFLEPHDGRIGEPLQYSMAVIAYTFLPFQGLINFIIFVTPRYRQWRKGLGDEASFWVVLKNSLSGREAPPPTRAMQRRAEQRRRANQDRPQTLAQGLTRVASRLLPLRSQADANSAADPAPNASHLEDRTTLVSSATTNYISWYSSAMEEDTTLRSSHWHHDEEDPSFRLWPAVVEENEEEVQEEAMMNARSSGGTSKEGANFRSHSLSEDDASIHLGPEAVEEVKEEVQEEATMNARHSGGASTEDSNFRLQRVSEDDTSIHLGPEAVEEVEEEVQEEAMMNA